jgi:AraC family transcriptional regulator
VLLWPRIYDAGYHIGGGGAPTTRSNYAGFQLQFVIAGEGHGLYRNLAFKAKKGEATCLDLRFPHRYEATAGRPWRVYWVRFDGPGCRGIFDAFDRAGGPVLPFSSIANVRKLFRRLFACLHSRPAGYDLLAWSILTGLIREIFIAVSIRSPKRTTDPAGIPRVLNFISNSYSERINLDRLAHIAGMSRYHFIRRFRISMNGITPMRYLCEFRLSQALHFIHTYPEMPIKKVAHQVGFANLSYFSRRFKASKGASPRKLRKLMPFPRSSWSSNGVPPPLLPRRPG